MLDFTPVYNQTIGLSELCAGLKPNDLRRLTNEMVDAMLELIDGCTDADVVFEPEDLDADDPYAETAEEVDLPWTLGHVIVHTTASAEESAFLAAEMARGVPTSRRRRSRYEIPWSTVTTIDQCRRRLEESRRMRLASLDLWPDEPHLDNSFLFPPNGETYTTIDRFVLGLVHDDSHLGQIAMIVRQARAVD